MIALAAVLLFVQTAEPQPPPRYGDRGSSHLGLILGLGSGGGGFRWAGGIDYGYFVVDRVAPGAEVEVSGGTGQLTTGLALATVRVVPLSTPGFSLFLIGRAGRLLLSDHPDGWAAGGGGGVIIFTGARIGVQLGYEVLELVPSSFCADLSGGCTVQGFQLGLVAGF